MKAFNSVMVSAFCALAMFAFEAGAVPEVRERQQQLKESLNQGLASGELTREEARQLFEMRVEINKLIQKKRDGEALSKEERALVFAKQKVLAEKTAALKANADKGQALSDVEITAFNEQMRIATGRKDGSLTADEYMRLNTELLKIQAQKMAADTPEEMDAVRARQLELSQRIYKQRHDGQARGAK